MSSHPLNRHRRLVLKLKVLAFAGMLVFAGGSLLLPEGTMVEIVRSNVFGPPPGKTGAPGEGTCNECHGGAKPPPLKSAAPQALAITAPAKYTPNQTYDVLVTLTGGGKIWGFQMTSLAGVLAAGTFANASPLTQVVEEGGRQYIQHTQSGTFFNQQGGAQWNVKWTAPGEDVGVVTFYAAGNQGNGDGTSSGDLIVLGQASSQPELVVATPTPTPTPTPPANGSIAGKVNYYFVAGSQQAKPVPGVVLSSTGPTAATATSDTSGAYSLTGLAPGAYTVTPSLTGQVNGISSQDAARIAQHVAGLVELTPTQQIAADTTGNGQVSSLDASRLAQFVAGVEATSITGQWKFLPASRTYPAVNGAVTGENYDAVLVGDVTGNWAPASAREEASVAINPDEQPCRAATPVLVPQSLDSVSGVSVEIQSGGVREGDVVAVPVRIPNIGQDLMAFDIDLRFDAAVLEPVPTDAVTIEGTLAADFTVTPNPTMPGRLVISGFGTHPIRGAGRLLDIKFRVIGQAGTSSNIAWQSFALNEDTVAIGTPARLDVVPRAGE
jgi:hypothetical protein